VSRRLRGFVPSWFFAPYAGSADMDLYKRLLHAELDFDVVQVRQGAKDPRVLGLRGAATFQRFEVETDHRQPRTRTVRDDFHRAVIGRFQAQPSGYDFLLSHSNEVPSHAAALACKRLAPELPWVAYFGDLVAKNPYVRHLPEYPLNDEDCQTEALTLEHADLVICNNTYQRDAMCSGALARFADKVRVIPHCFEPALYPAAPPPISGSGKFTFMHLGTLYQVKRRAEPVLQAVERLLSVYPSYAGRFEVIFYGGAVPAPDLQAWWSMRHRDHVRFEGAVPYLDSLGLMQQAGALLLIDGMFTEAEDGVAASPFLPGKLLDYLGARRPVLGVTMARGPSADLLGALGHLHGDARPDKVAWLMKRCIDGRVSPDYAQLEPYTARAVGKQMEAAIREVVKA
jgi:hypothetical protein